MDRRRSSSTLRFAVFPSPLGELILAADDAGLRSIELPRAGGDGPGAAVEPGWVEDPRFGPLAAAAGQLRAYFAGRRERFALPLAPEGTAFQQEAWAMLRAIPFGRTISYGRQARRMGRPRAARAVGAANGANPLPIVIPCHRVVAGDGSLGGYSSGLDHKRWLLEHERSVLAGGGCTDAAMVAERHSPLSGSH